MALPPIISSLPIFKLFKPANNAAPAKTEAGQGTPVKNTAKNTARNTVPQDSLHLSAAARRSEAPLAGTINDPVQAYKVAGQTRALLTDNNLSLGLDPEFTG